MAVLVQGILRFPDNSPIAGASLKFTASKFISSGVPIGASVVITTDGIGAYSQSILEGSYHIYYKQLGHQLYTHIIDVHLLEGDDDTSIGDPRTIEDIIGTLPGDTPIYTGCADIPSPSKFVTNSGFTAILLEWAGIDYVCHDVTEIWISATEDFETKVLLDTTESHIYNHPIGHDGIRYYWLRFRNLNSEVGNWFSTSAVAGRTSQNPGEVLADLQQDVYDSAIFSALRTNINSSFYQALAPTAKLNGDSLASGDTWIDSDDNQRHVWDTAQVPPIWLAVTDKETLVAAQALVGTQEVADGEIKGFFQTTEPLFTESSFGDIWINTGLTTPLTFTSIKRFEADDSSSTGTLSWRSAPASALGLSYVKAFNTEGDLSKLKNSYDTFVTTTLPDDLSAIQSQLDGNITTWFKDTSPTLNNAPASSWGTIEIKNVHLGDLYYDRVTGYAYRFAHEDIDDTPDAGVIYSWVQITDTDVTAALANAKNAQDTADDKRRVFVVEPGTPYDVGDLWTTGTELKRCRLSRPSGVYVAADWEIATSYITTYYTNKSPQPSNPGKGDLWVVLDEADALYRYTGTAWQLLSVATLANVDTKILEQKGICKINTTDEYTYHATQALCEVAEDGSATGRTWEELGALAARTDTVSSTVDTNTAAVQVNATSINGVQAQYSVKLDVNDHVSGFGLSAGSVCVDASGDIIYDADGVTITDGSICTAASGTIKTDSTFIVAADTFAITGTNETPVTPFIVRPGTVNGLCYVNGVENTYLDEETCMITSGGSWVPPNTSLVGIQGSLVLDGTMNANAIVAGSITGDHIAGTTISAQHMNARSVFALTIQSEDYVAGTQGWKLNSDGNLDVNNGNFRGDISGASGVFSGAIKANQILSHEGADTFDISSFGNAGPENDSNIYGGVIKGAVIEGGYLVAMGEHEYTSFYSSVYPGCSFADEINGKWRYRKQFGSVLANSGYSSAVSAGTYLYDVYAWNKCSDSLRRLTSSSASFHVNALSNMLSQSGSHSGTNGHTFDNTWSIGVILKGVTETLTIRIRVGYNSSDWYWNIYIDNVHVDGGSSGSESDRSRSGYKTLHGIRFDYSMSYGGEDYYSGWANSVNGDAYYNIAVQVSDTIQTFTFDSNDRIGIVTSGGSMKIPTLTVTS